MSSGTQSVIDWDSFFRSVADHLKNFAAKHWPLEADGSASDNHLALHKMFAAFPFGADLLMFDTAGVTHPQIGRLAVAIRYDLSRPNTPSVQIHGIISLQEIERHAALVESVLEVEAELLDDLRRWPSMFSWSSAAVIHLVPYDPRLTATEYADELADNLARRTDLIDLFSTKIDFNAKYGLSPDPHLTDEQLSQIDGLTQCFVKLSDGKPLTLSERHASISHIQLIPQVPESVARTFRLAKRLYVCAYFEYGFFTVSLHYAHLALDAALHARWSATLPASVVLSYHDKKSRQTHQQTMNLPSHMKIREFSRQAGWRVSSVKVDGKVFPHTVNGVVGELTRQGYITQWQRGMIERFYSRMRNNLTHLEFAPVHSPAPGAFTQIAYLINYLFGSLPMPPTTPAP